MCSQANRVQSNEIRGQAHESSLARCESTSPQYIGWQIVDQADNVQGLSNTMDDFHRLLGPQLPQRSAVNTHTGHY